MEGMPTEQICNNLGILKLAHTNRTLRMLELRKVLEMVEIIKYLRLH